LWDMADRHAGSPRELLPWLFEKDRPTALIVYQGTYGIPTIFKSVELMGLHVPKDLSLVTFDTCPFIFGGFPLTTMIIPFREIGQLAVATLVDRINSEANSFKTMKLPFALYHGMSCAPLSS